MKVAQIFGWEPRIQSLRAREREAQAELVRLRQRRDDMLLEREIGNAAATKQLAKLDTQIDTTRKRLGDLRQTLQSAEQRLAEERREVDERKHNNWVKDVENTVEIRMQLAAKADRKLDEFLGVLAEMVTTADKLKGMGADREVKRLVDLPAFRDRLQAAYGVPLNDFFPVHVNHAHVDAMIPLAELEERQRRVYMQRVYGE